MPGHVRYRQLASLGIGLAASGIAAWLSAAGVIGDFEGRALDLRFRLRRDLPASDRIVHVDITDRTLEQVGPWPWDWRLHALLVDTLCELGAEQIGFDIEFRRPHRAWSPVPSPSDLDLPLGLRALGGYAGQVIDEPSALERALRASGRTWVAYALHLLPPEWPRERLERAARAVLEAAPETGDAALLSRYPGLAAVTLRPALWLRLRPLIEADFTLDASALASRAGLPVERVGEILESVKRDVARERVGAYLAAHPEAGVGEVLEAVLGTRSAPGSDADTVRWAYRWWQGARAVLSHGYAEAGRGTALLPHVASMLPPHPRVAGAARGSGFTYFEAEADGTVRRIPLLVRMGDRILPQLGFAMALAALGVSADELRIDPGGRWIEWPDPHGRGGWTRARLDGRGRVLVNWYTPPATYGLPRSGGWAQVFEHIPAARVMEIPINRLLMERNREVLAERYGDLIRRVMPEAAQEYADLRARAAETRERLRRSPDDAAAKWQQEEIEAALKELEREALSRLEAVAKSVDPESPEAAELRALARDLAGGDLAAQIEQSNARLEAAVRQRAAELRPMVEGRIVLVGYTATALADMKPTPLFPATPGVLVHSNVINMVLNGRIPYSAPHSVDVAVILLCGAVVTGCVSYLRPGASVVVLVGLMGGYAAINTWVVFGRMDCHLDLMGSELAMVASGLGVMAYRWLTEFRGKRELGRALASYTSPAIARQLVEEIDEATLDPVEREVTCFFSDLEGFTGIAERLGPQRTREVLDPYLSAMSAVLIEHHAIVNKFIGDGIFAFFNAPIYPLERHAEAACAAALASLRALEAVVGGEPVAGQMPLKMRIGLASGRAFVGNYGSASKLDYTVIGDTVNLASRLESANKVFGTQILVSESVRSACEERFVFRPLGAIRVVGRSEPASVFELVGERGAVTEQQERHCQAFAALVEAFARGRWAQARAYLEEARQLMPQDRAVAVYERLIAEYEARPLPEAWRGQIVLTEK